MNQQGRLYSPVSKDPAALELFLSPDVSHRGQHSITAGFAALFVPAVLPLRAAHGIPSRKSFLSFQNHCQEFFLVARLGLVRVRAGSVVVLWGLGSAAFLARELKW